MEYGKKERIMMIDVKDKSVRDLFEDYTGGSFQSELAWEDQQKAKYDVIAFYDNNPQPIGFRQKSFDLLVEVEQYRYEQQKENSSDIRYIIVEV